MALTNTPAYNSAVSITTVKSFYKMGPGFVFTRIQFLSIFYWSFNYFNFEKNENL